PASPRPSQGLPSSTRPPPTPVPQNTPTNELYGRPAPRRNSPSVATCTSFPTRTGTPRCSRSQGPSLNPRSQSGRFRACETVPVRPLTSPGEPTPTPASLPGSTPAASAASRSASDICSATPLGPPVVGVGRRASPSTFHLPSTITV